MSRYFIEVAYKGSSYSGSQKQKNANSVQSEIEKALTVFFKVPFKLTGASRTDAGVHAIQNFYHFDTDALGAAGSIGEDVQALVYRLNAILPWDIAIKNILKVKETAHCRYDAIEREYKYFIYWKKDPFLKERAYFFPYKLQLNQLNAGASTIITQQDFSSFTKRSIQVNNFLCTIKKSYWTLDNDVLVYTVSGNRFLRGMVRGLVATMLKLGRGLISKEEFEKIFIAQNSSFADFSAPSQGLFLNVIKYPFHIFD